jgi:hypothetical protein
MRVIRFRLICPNSDIVGFTSLSGRRILYMNRNKHKYFVIKRDRQTERQKAKEADRQAKRRKDLVRERQADIQAGRQACRLTG